MVEGALTPVSYVVLALLARRGPRTPYELKAAVAASVGNFWTFPHAQLYKEPPRLAAAGLLTEEREDGGRRRRLFRITPAGRDAVAAWLAEPTGRRGEVRDLGLLKLSFGDLATPDDLRALAQAQVRAHAEQLAVLEGHLGVEMPPTLRQVLEQGIAIERLSITFWTGAAR